jgi:hypothetical protein
VLDFDVLILQQPCTDRPNLRLAVRAAQPTAYPNLPAGSRNPFALLGLGEVVLENGGCRASPRNNTGCPNATAMDARWSFDSPEVVAFFLPMSYAGAGNIFLSACTFVKK